MTATLFRQAIPAFILLSWVEILNAALWTDPVQETDGWKESPWFGWIYEFSPSWIYHREHGMLYLSGADEESLWFWDAELGWMWTGSSTYPNLFSVRTESWLYYLETTSAPRQIYHYAYKDWAALYDFHPPAVTRGTESWDWRYQTHTATDDLELISFDRTTSVRTFELTVIENDWIRVKLLPDWGGRILSIFYKPLEFEMLYYPRAGSRSRIIEAPGTFYYDWILLAYGINPTFPSGEHGKYWGVPWPLELIEESADKVTFRMSQVDDDYRFDPEDVTNLVVEMDVSLYRDRFYLDVEYTLTNPGSEAVAFEFWTPAAFSPTRLSESAMPLDTEIMVNHDEVSLYDWWQWMRSKETYLGPDKFGINPFGVYTFDALRDLANWDDVGIAYAYPYLEIPYFGVLNHEDGFGAMRTADAPEAAPGMKIWGGGIDSFMWELWSGVTPQFFLTETLPAHSSRTWHEYYLPFAGLSDVSHATKYGVAQAAFLSLDNDDWLSLELSGTMPGETWAIEVYPVVDGTMRTTPATAFLISFDETGSLQKRTVKMDKALIPANLEAWSFIIKEAFTGEERMAFSVRP